MTSPLKRRNHLAWIGPLVGLVGFISYFLVFARVAVLRDFPWVNLPMVFLGVALAGFGVWRAYAQSETFRGKVAAPIGLVFALFFAGLFNMYIFSLSSSIPEATELTLSLTEAPDFTLTAMDGASVQLSDYQGQAVALIFYRGFW